MVGAGEPSQMMTLLSHGGTGLKAINHRNPQDSVLARPLLLKTATGRSIVIAMRTFAHGPCSLLVKRCVSLCRAALAGRPAFF